MHLAEGAAEVGGVAEAGFQGGVGDRVVGVEEQTAGVMNAAALVVVRRGTTRCAREEPREVIGTAARTFGRIGDGEGLTLPDTGFDVLQADVAVGWAMRVPRAGEVPDRKRPE